jgi:hypothetical protein
MSSIADIAPAVFRWATAMFKQFPIMSAIVVIMAIIMVSMIMYMATHVITGIPIAISRVQQQYFSDYVGFPIDNPELDAQSISYGEITITNISTKEKVAIDIILHITGSDGTNIKTRADLIGPFGMMLGKDDKEAKHSANSPFGEAQKYFRTPVELVPGQIERRRLEFLFGSAFRDQFTTIMLHNHNYKFDLEISDLISGIVITMNLPAEYRGDQ